MKRLLTVAGLALAMSAPALAAPSPMPMHSMAPKHTMMSGSKNSKTMMTKKTTNPAMKTGPGVGAMSGKPVSPPKASGPNGAPSHSP